MLPSCSFASSVRLQFRVLSFPASPMNVAVSLPLRPPDPLSPSPHLPCRLFASPNIDFAELCGARSSLPPQPEFGGPKSLRCCCAKGVGHRAQLMLRARRGARENDYPVPLLRTPTPQKLSLSCPHSEHRGGSQLPSLSTSCHVADRERISSCSARRVAKAKVLPEPPGVLTTWRRSPLYLYL